MITPIFTFLTIIGLIFANPGTIKPAAVPTVLAQKDYSLANRYANPYVNSVFADNILLTLAYMDKKVKKASDISWNHVKATGEYRLVLEPGQTFAFHDAVLQEYKNKVVATTNAHFSSTEGFKSDGWLVGDGVCHLASFMNAVSREAGLDVKAPVSHSFANIPDVPQKLGVSIYSSPNDKAGSSLQNLYITNTRAKTIIFIFDHKKDMLDIRIEELS